MKFFTAAAGLLTTSLLASTTYAAPTNVTVVPRGGTAASIVGSIAKVAKGIFQQIEQDKLVSNINLWFSLYLAVRWLTLVM